jgi:predicted DNA-binding transcriptional regulator AlpA
MSDAQFLDTEAAARFLGLSKHTLLAWRSRRVGPAYLKFNETNVRYEQAELVRWLNSKRVGTKDTQMEATM